MTGGRWSLGKFLTGSRVTMDDQRLFPRLAASSHDCEPVLREGNTSSPSRVVAPFDWSA